MLTENYYAMSLSISSRVTLPVKTLDGAVKNIMASISSQSDSYNKWFDRMLHYGSASSSGIVFSNSAAKPTLNDFALEGEIPSSKLSLNPPAKIGVIRDRNGNGIVATYGVTNIDSSPITISSLFFVWESFEYGSGPAKFFLADHTLLTSPITLRPGESKQITYTIRFNYPKSGA